MEATKLVLFEVNHHVYGIHIEQVISIERYRESTPLANVPEVIEGMLTVREQMALSYDLRTKFQWEKKTADDNTRMVLVQIEDLIVAFIVDCVIGIVEMEQESFTNLPKVIQSEQTSYVESIGKIQDRIAIILNIGTMLDKENINQIQSVLNS